MGHAVRNARGGHLLLLALLGLTLVLAAPRASGQAPDLSDYPWLYLRDGQAPAEGAAAVSLIAVGDVMPGRGVSDVSQPLQDATPWLREADLTLGNLEVALDSGKPASSRFLPAVKMTALQRSSDERIVLTAPGAVAHQLRSAGFDLLSLANNHSLDLGPAGLAYSSDQLRAEGITPLGAGPGEAAYTPVIREVRGMRLAFLAFTAVPDPDADPAAGDWQPAQWDQALAIAAVAEARRQAHAVVVSLHWGEEYALRTAPWQRAAAEVLVDAGADLVVGHHPHVVQEVAPMVERQGFVAYSLGNFLFDQQTAQTRQGLALRAFFDEAGLVAVQGLPVQAGLRPRLMDGTESQVLFARVTPPAPRAAFACDENGCHQASDLPGDGEESESIFWSGAIDLTGDGEPEIIRRAAQQVAIYESGEAAWQSPPQWRVVDVALGDPNDDGRGELVLALWQRDAEGHERSQPYIVGHRAGEYGVIWGGRPVSAPILELALGDVDGDNAQELVVLEQAPEGARLAVWRWQGWNFSLFWRSEAGPYEELRLVRADDGGWLVTVRPDH